MNDIRKNINLIKEFNQLNEVDNNANNLRLKTQIKGLSIYINPIEEELRNYVMNNNIKIVQLNSVKNGLLTKTLYIDLIGNTNTINAIKDYISNIID